MDMEIVSFPAGRVEIEVEIGPVMRAGIEALECATDALALVPEKQEAERKKLEARCKKLGEYLGGMATIGEWDTLGPKEVRATVTCTFALNESGNFAPIQATSSWRGNQGRRFPYPAFDEAWSLVSKAQRMFGDAIFAKLYPDKRYTDAKAGT